MTIRLGLLAAGATLALALTAAAPARAAGTIVLQQGFDDVGALAGWSFINNSNPAGQSWFQGNAGIFTAHAGAADAYIGANYLSAANGAGTIDNWLITPEVTTSLDRYTTLSFYTRAAGTPGYSDQLQVLFKGKGASDYTSLSTIVLGSGDTAWTEHRFVVEAPDSGTFAFRYLGNAAMADYIGLDSITVTAVPEPGTWAMLLGGLGAVALWSRRRIPVRGAAVHIVAAAACMAGAHGAALAAEPPATPTTSTTSEAGMVVVRDQETGALRAPTAAEFQQLRRADPRAAAPQAAPQPTLRADGSRRARVGDRAVYTIATRGSDGRLHSHCIAGTGDAGHIDHAGHAAQGDHHAQR